MFINLGQPNFLSGIVDKCVKEGSSSTQEVLSVIAQGIVGEALFQPEQLVTGNIRKLLFLYKKPYIYDFINRQSSIFEVSSECIRS